VSADPSYTLFCVEHESKVFALLDDPNRRETPCKAGNPMQEIFDDSMS
jgi:hypothetical protein